MRRALGILAAAAMVTLCTAAFAQGGPGGGGPGGPGGQGGGRRMGMGQGMMGGGLRLLTIKEVQAELKMTQPQIDKVEPKQQELQQANRELFQNGGGMNATPEERQKLMEQVQANQTKAVNDILDTTQQKRFRQLELQQAGAQAFQRKDVATELKITAEQRTRMQEVQRSSMQDNMQIFQQLRDATPEQRTELMAKMQKAREEVTAKVVAVLTPDQQKQYKAMLGTPFKFPPMPFGRMGGNRRNIQ